jgi:hypothetical protein
MTDKPLTPEEMAEVRADPMLIHVYDAHRIVATLDVAMTEPTLTRTTAWMRDDCQCSVRSPDGNHCALASDYTTGLCAHCQGHDAARAAAPSDGLREAEANGDIRAFWSGDSPRRVIVLLPPIGPDGRCTRCGSTPSRDTGSCRCHRVVIEQVGAIDDPVASLPYTLDAARVAAPSDGLVADRLARAFHEAKKVGGPWGPCAYRDATGDMVPVAFDDNSEDDFACLCRAMANHVVAEYAALAATPTDD